MARPPRVVFAGAYGIQSQGDDAPLVVMTRLLRQHVGSFEGVVVARPPGGPEYQALGLRSTPNFEYPTKAESRGKWFRGFNPGDDRQDLRALDVELSGSRLLILGAGNSLIDQTIDILRGPVPAFLVLTLMARMCGVPVMLYGLSIGPLTTSLGRKYARLCLDLAAVVTVRDAQSVRLAAEIGYTGPCRLLPDPVLGLPVPPSRPESAPALASWRQAQEKGAGVVAVSVRALPPGLLPHETWLARLAALLDTLYERNGLCPLFIPQCTYAHGDPREDDRVVAAQMVGAMRHRSQAVLVRDILDAEACLSLYAGARLALCTRLHGVVFAAMNATPVVAFGYHPKVTQFMEWLGQPNRVVSVRTPQDADCWLDQAEQALATPMAERNRMAHRVAEGRRQVDAYGKIAAGWLSKGKKERMPPAAGRD